MALPDTSIQPRLLESAKEEFLRCGFEKASLKTICEDAGVTTGALYKRYKGKEELFCAVVADTVAALEGIVHQKADVDFATLTARQLVDAWRMDEDYMLWWFDFLFRRRDGFVLLLCCAQGTRYTNFQHEWVETMNEATYGYYQEAARRGLATHGDLTREEMHVLITSFWATIYEPFIHDFTWEQIKKHCTRVCQLFHWNEVLGFPQE